jgi:pyruvate kinase
MAGKLIDEGLCVARLNFSHGDHAEHYGQMKGVQDAMKERPGSHVSILLDTKGP